MHQLIRRKIFFFITAVGIVLFGTISQAVAQPVKSLDQLRETSKDDRLAFRFGFYGDFGRNYHQSQAHVYCCDEGCGIFGNGTGRSYNFGLLVEKPLVKMLDLALTVGYAERGGAFGFAIDSSMRVLSTGGYTKLIRQHDYTAQLPEVITSLGVRFTPIKKLPFYLTTGFVYSIPLASSSNFKQTDAITSPSGVVFPSTNTNFKVDSEGTISNIKSSLGLRGAIGYPFPLGKDLTASPEINYYFPLTQTRADYLWKIATLEGGVAIRYNIY
ncbi:MAG TPA: outer membrane beta-barrel protein, partial [Candidatus Kapabacteria bacterium]|nr:outer membrane beta-barrel protein [Candidatus Kapabacteria bacterium]